MNLGDRLEKIFIPADKLFRQESKEEKFLVNKIIPKASLTGLVG